MKTGPVFTLWSSMPRRDWLAAATAQVTLTPAQEARVKQRVLKLKGTRRKSFQTPVKAETFRQSFD